MKIWLLIRNYMQNYVKDPVVSVAIRETFKELLAAEDGAKSLSRLFLDRDLLMILEAHSSEVQIKAVNSSMSVCDIYRAVFLVLLRNCADPIGLVQLLQDSENKDIFGYISVQDILYNLDARDNLIAEEAFHAGSESTIQQLQEAGILEYGDNDVEVDFDGGVDSGIEEDGEEVREKPSKDKKTIH
jgi:hypothetical protein